MGKNIYHLHAIYDGEQVLGVVGIEFEAGHQYDTYRSLRLLLPLFILLFSLGACLVSRLLFRRISNPFTGYVKYGLPDQLKIGTHISWI